MVYVLRPSMLIHPFGANLWCVFVAVLLFPPSLDIWCMCVDAEPPPLSCVLYRRCTGKLPVSADHPGRRCFHEVSAEISAKQIAKGVLGGRHANAEQMFELPEDRSWGVRPLSFVRCTLSCRPWGRKVLFYGPV